MAISSVTQLSSKSTGVTLNRRVGKIVMNNAALASATDVTFTVTCTAVGADDVVVVNHASVGALGSYSVEAHTLSDGSFKIRVRNNSGSSLSEAIVLQYRVLRSGL